MSLLGIIGCSKAHSEIVGQIRRIAAFDAEVLITGPTGVGKEVYARLIHSSSRRSQRPFVAVNCGALPGDLFENELFGHNASAYTGAHTDTEGLAAAAEDGTLFLDEVDSLLPPAQIKLLRFIQFREYRRLGETRLRKSNTRIIAATNRELYKAVGEGKFREDLFYRLRVIPIDVPPLRERQDDVLEFVEAFSEFYAKSYHVPLITFHTDARQALKTHDWPGNVRELENCVRYLTCLQLGRPIERSDLPFVPRSPYESKLPEELLALPLRQAKKKLISHFEKEYLLRALSENAGNVTRAARASGKNRRAFFELMRQYGLNGAAEFERHNVHAVIPELRSGATPRPPDPRNGESTRARAQAHSAGR